MIDLTSEFGRHVAERLRDEPVVWLTTVDAGGNPRPHPVWFYWDGARFLIHSKPDSAKVKNLLRNPRVSLHFEGAETFKGDVVVFLGTASVQADAPVPHPGYVEKYERAALDHGYSSVESICARYRALIRVTPDALRDS